MKLKTFTELHHATRTIAEISGVPYSTECGRLHLNGHCVFDRWDAPELNRARADVLHATLISLTGEEVQ